MKNFHVFCFHMSWTFHLGCQHELWYFLFHWFNILFNNSEVHRKNCQHVSRQQWVFNSRAVFRLNSIDSTTSSSQRTRCPASRTSGMFVNQQWHYGSLRWHCLSWTSWQQRPWTTTKAEFYDSSMNSNAPIQQKTNSTAWWQKTARQPMSCQALSTCPSLKSWSWQQALWQLSPRGFTTPLSCTLQFSIPTGVMGWGHLTPEIEDWSWRGQPLQETARRGTQWEGSHPMRWQHSDHGSQHLGKQHQHGRQHHQRSYQISQRGDKLEVDLRCWWASWPYNNVACRWSTTAPSVGPCQHSETLVGMHHAVATDNANTQGTSGSRQ